MIQCMGDLIDLPLHDETPRIVASAIYAEIAWQHWDAVRFLSENDFHASANSLLRIQFEALLRSIWCLHCASDTTLEKLGAPLDSESEQSSIRLPQAGEMLSDLEKKPETANVYVRLAEFKHSSWKALNSYVHAGIHPLRREVQGYPITLILQTIRISNGLGLLTAIQRGILTGDAKLQKELIECCKRFSECLPPEKPPVDFPAARKPD